jgi:hypothetical protein
MDIPMLPVIDYGGIALVIPHISAVGGVIEEKKRYGFDVFLSGHSDPVFVAFSKEDEADEAREEMVEAVARYYFVKDMGLELDDDDENIKHH